MNVSRMYRTEPRPLSRKAVHLLASAAFAVLTINSAQAEVSQSPLFLGGGNVPGNLALVPSVEWPTINSMANLGNYSETRRYTGYFDPAKCYRYQHHATEAQRHFYPVRFHQNANHRCNDVGEWSGNFMNWAATQTIDPFRSALTGGYRVVDTPTDTWLEKARHDGQGGTGVYPNRRIPANGSDAVMVSGATPFAENWMRMRIEGQGNRMRFRLNDDGVNHNVLPYDPDATTGTDRAYEVSVRVRVCVPGLLEANCRQYSQGHKPEGLIQQYADELRVSVFGYLNDSHRQRDGGVLRARKKFVGQTRLVPEVGEQANPNREWDPQTGVFVRNPDPDDAAATSSQYGVSVLDSGAINYLNKFGQMTNNSHKSTDPVSELYYAALRYFRDLGNVPEYTNVPGNTGVGAARAVDGFPVITDWEDPIQYMCQKNVILGIGDVYTHRDKNLPGSPYGNDEPPTPAAVAADPINVVTWTNRVGQNEGLGNIGSTSEWTGRENSAYIAGLAYYANTTDLRPDLPGTQTVSTHWVDVLEAQTLEPPRENQFYLAAKYGGFRPPEDFDPATHSGDLPLEWWHSNGQVLQSFGPRASPAGVSFPRPDNYYLAGEADQMVASLTEAFARIAAELRASASSVATNSTRLDTDTAVFQAAFDSTRWSGELQAFRINQDGTIQPDALWNAATRLDDLSEVEVANSRRVFTVTPPEAVSGGALRSNTGIDFQWNSLAESQRAALRQQPGGLEPVSEVLGQQRLAYLRGARTLEQLAGGPFRQRDSRLGDIVNSDPQFIHRQDFRYGLLDQASAFAGTNAGQAYLDFRQSAAYQSRPPMVVVGANDGMLHGFDASLGGSGGEELFAFVPHGVFDNLYELTLPEYSHRYYVDGTPRISDVWLGSSLGWRTLAVGATGAGGRSVFALDITNPVGMTSNNVLWEFTHPAMGYTISQPAIVPLPTGEFAVVVTSGYGTDPDLNPRIWLLRPSDGSVISSLEISNATAGDLGTPLVVDLSGDRVANRIYVGDTEGNVWRVDLGTTGNNLMSVPQSLRQGNTPQPLFVARNNLGERQAITAPLASAFTPLGEHMLLFGTGSFYRVDDNVVHTDPPPALDTFYGVIDRGQTVNGRSNLLEQEIIAELNVSGNDVRGVTDNAMAAGLDGWYLDLVWKGQYGGPGPKGERVVSRALVRDDRVIFTTLIPEADPCAFGGDSWLMELNTYSGSRLNYAVFDLDGDGNFDDGDWITVPHPDGSGTIRIPASGIRPGIGIISTPAVIGGVGDRQDEIKVFSGSSGELIRIMERGAIGIGRQSWRQLR